MAATARAREAKFGQLLATRLNGAKTALPDGSSIGIAGVTYNKGDLVNKYQTLFSAYDLVEELRGQLDKALKQRALLAQDASNFVEDADNALKAYFSSDSASLKKLGLAQRAMPAPLTPEKALAKKVKGQQTRKMRNTMGSRQQEDVKFQGEPKITVEPQPAPPASNGGTNGSTPPPAV
jgi:hypothetical protein